LGLVHGHESKGMGKWQYIRAKQGEFAAKKCFEVFNSVFYAPRGAWSN
jgi:hypothetical protein